MEQEIKKVAIEAVKKSAKALIPRFKNFDRHQVMLKPGKETLTEDDILSQKIIINEIQNNFIGHNILSEEIGLIDNNSDYLWILDPIDGTTSFTMMSPLWSISLAVAQRDSSWPSAADFKKSKEDDGREYDLIFGVVYIPMLDELFVAAKGQGATVNGRTIHVSNFSSGKTLNAYCHDHSPKELKDVVKYFSYQKAQKTNIMQLGSASIELCYIAAGRIETLTVFGANAWDVAAGIMIVREAGGRVTDFRGRDWQIGGRQIIASNGKVHKELLNIINKELKIKKDQS